MRRVVDITPGQQNQRRQISKYKPNPIKQEGKGHIQDLWASKTELGKFEMMVQWNDGSTSIELTDVRLRVGGSIRL